MPIVIKIISLLMVTITSKFTTMEQTYCNCEKMFKLINKVTGFISRNHIGWHQSRWNFPESEKNHIHFDLPKFKNIWIYMVSEWKIKTEDKKVLKGEK